MLDLIIIGGGGAGLFAAYEAKKNGVSEILILECQKRTGGNSAAAGGNIYAVETKYTDPARNSMDEELGEALYFHHYDMVQPDLIRNWIHEARNTLTWLEERGYQYEMDSLGEGYTHRAVESPGVAWFHNVLTPLADELREDGVEIRTETVVTAVVKGDDGHVCGVVAQTTGKEPEIICARAVLLSCGGFLSNDELMEKYFPMYYVKTEGGGPRSNTPGNGIAIAASGGAGLYLESGLIKETGMCFGPSPDAPGRIFGMDGSVLVNRVGLRYVNEALWNQNYSANGILHQPGKEAFIIYSAETLDHVMRQPMMASDRDRYMAYINKAAEEGKLCRYFNTIAEMAEWIGADPDVLRDTIDRYNGFCEEGVDHDFLKAPRCLIPLRTGPWLAIPMHPMYIDTMGPVMVDGELHIVDEDRHAIPGFYAAGVIAAGWEGRDYMRFGSALSWATTSGFMVGRTIARDLGKCNTI